MRKTKIIALIDEPFVNTYETLYYEACRNPAIDFKFVLIKSADSRIQNKNYEYLQEMMRSHNLPYIDGYDVNTNKEINLKKLKPDVVLVQTPYDGVKRSETYSSTNLMKYTRVVHISYGSSIVDFDKPPFSSGFFRNNSFFRNCWFCAVENPTVAKILNVYHPNKFLSFGCIKLDKYINYKHNNDFKFAERPPFKHVIAWKPRWVVKPDESNFLTYIDFFKHFVSENKDTMFLFVSHPLLKSTLITENLYTQKQVEDLFSYFENQKNVKILENEDFLDYIACCDVFIGDYCSTIVEASILGHPVIYTPTKITFNDFGKKFAKQAYIANNKKELEFYIKECLEGKDALKKQREKFIDIASPAAKQVSYAYDLLNYIQQNLPKKANKYNVLRKIKNFFTHRKDKK